MLAMSASAPTLRTPGSNNQGVPESDTPMEDMANHEYLMQVRVYCCQRVSRVLVPHRCAGFLLRRPACSPAGLHPLTLCRCS